jgi:molybdopterin molybdotransferase
MIQVSEAFSFIESQARSFGEERVPLLQSVGRVLAEDVYADRDFPPFDRVMMDGIAISITSFDDGQRSFRIAGTLAAGSSQRSLTDATTCLEVMTGAVIPEHADAIIPYEECVIEAGVATITASVVKRLQHVHLAGSDTKNGTVLLERNQRITPAAMGILASVGKSEVAVLKLPKIAICSTGDELVDVDANPLPHQIRRSNSYMLAAALQAEGVQADLHHLPDEKEEMLRTLGEILPRYDAMLFSGAVSKGKYDFLPEVLTQLGMKTIFHRIAQKPGKPMLFGCFETNCVVFGFPGNPASTLVCYQLYFLNWFRKSLNQKVNAMQARLSEDVVFNPALTYHLLVTLKEEEGVLIARPCPAANSGDMVGLERANAMISLPAERSRFEKGEVFPVRLLDNIF